MLELQEIIAIESYRPLGYFATRNIIAHNCKYKNKLIIDLLYYTVCRKYTIEFFFYFLPPNIYNCILVNDPNKNIFLKLTDIFVEWILKK